MAAIDLLGSPSPCKLTPTCTKTLTAHYSPGPFSQASPVAHASPLRASPGTPAKAQKVFNELFQDISSPIRSRVYTKIRQKQRAMGPFYSEIVPQSQAFPQVMVTRDEIHRMGEQVGAGAYSEVFASKAMTLRPKEGFSPSRPKPMVLKRGRYKRQSVEEEARRLKSTLTPQSESNKYIDCYKGVYRTRLGFPLSVHERFDGTLDHMSLDRVALPVSYALPRLCGAMKGLAAIHLGGAIHRDIKGANILFMKETSGRTGALTDFGLLMKKPQEMHRTTGTVLYLAPFIFQGFEGQVQRRGMQTEAADIFAFGRTVQIDVLAKMLKKLGQEKGIEVADLMQEILPQKIAGSLDELRGLAERAPHHTFYQKGMKGKSDSVYVFPTAEQGYQKILELLTRFENHLPPREIQLFKQLALLAKDLQHVNPDHLPNTEEVIARLEEIEESSREVASVPSKSRVRKRHLLKGADSTAPSHPALVVKSPDLSGLSSKIDSPLQGVKRLKSCP